MQDLGHEWLGSSPFSENGDGCESATRTWSGKAPTPRLVAPAGSGPCIDRLFSRWVAVSKREKYWRRKRGGMDGRLPLAG